MAWALKHIGHGRPVPVVLRTLLTLSVRDRRLSFIREKQLSNLSACRQCRCHQAMGLRDSLTSGPLQKLRLPRCDMSRRTSSTSPDEMSAENKAELRTLYPETEAYDEGWLKVSDLHSLKYWQYGNSSGNPVVFVHGGPGGGISPRDSRYFDPEAYRIILFDQRGSGQSTPPAELEENSTWHSVEDMETLRRALGVERWLVFGGSWGSTLSLAYAQTHPDRVKGLVLRGIFLLRPCELEWFYEDRGGACMIYPDYFEKYRDFIPRAERRCLLGAYYRRLTGDDPQQRLEAAKHWSGWEMATSRLHVDEDYLRRTENEQWALQFARIECHYFINGGFLYSDNHLLDNVCKIRHIPATIVQGRYDVVCAPDSAWKLHKAWPEAEFHFVQDAGHSALEPGTTARLVEAADKYRTL